VNFSKNLAEVVEFTLRKTCLSKILPIFWLKNENIDEKIITGFNQVFADHTIVSNSPWDSFEKKCHNQCVAIITISL
jgi:hypothetical protein